MLIFFIIWFICGISGSLFLYNRLKEELSLKNPNDVIWLIMIILMGFFGLELAILIHWSDKIKNKRRNTYVDKM